MYTFNKGVFFQLDYQREETEKSSQLTLNEFKALVRDQTCITLATTVLHLFVKVA